MKAEFDVKITTADLFDYMLFHTYSGFSGWFGLVVGILFVAWYFMNPGTAIYYLAAGIIIILYVPFSLYTRAKKQASTNEFFKNPIHYVINEEGVTVTQGEYEMFQEWNIVYKVRSTKKSLLVYTSAVNAWIFPKQALAEQKEAMIRLIRDHVDPVRIKIKQ